MTEPYIHINWTRYSETRCIVIDCPTCERQRRASAQFQEWYGWHTICAGCGDSWTDGEMHERPFAPRWRNHSRAIARSIIESIGLVA